MATKTKTKKSFSDKAKEFADKFLGRKGSDEAKSAKKMPRKAKKSAAKKTASAAKITAKKAVKTASAVVAPKAKATKAKVGTKKATSKVKPKAKVTKAKTAPAAKVAAAKVTKAKTKKAAAVKSAPAAKGKKLRPKSLPFLKSKLKGTKVAQTELGKRQDSKFVALPPGKRIARKVSIITKADGVTTFKRKNPRAKAGNVYRETRSNRSDRLGFAAEQGGQM